MDVVATSPELPTPAALDFLKEYESLVKWIPVDIREKGHVEGAIRQTRVDTILHCAAVTSVSGDASVCDMLVANVVGTRNVLEAARSLGLSRVVFLSSGAVYGTRAPYPPKVGENHALRGDGPYAVSKIAAEQLCRNYAREHNLSAAICRLGTLYGPMEIANPHRPRVSIPCRLVNHALEGGSIKVFGLSRRRPFCYVGDAARAVIDLASSAHLPSDTFNVGTPESVALSDLLDTLSRLRPGFAFEVVESHHDADLAMTQDDERPVLETAHLESLLGALPWSSVEEGIAKYMNWLGKC
jgi:UDP-glucose 4-epimerase